MSGTLSAMKKNKTSGDGCDVYHEPTLCHMLYRCFCMIYLTVNNNSTKVDMSVPFVQRRQ